MLKLRLPIMLIPTCLSIIIINCHNNNGYRTQPFVKVSSIAPHISLEYSTKDFALCSLQIKQKYTMAENGTDIPVDVAPKHIKFVLSKKNGKSYPACAHLDEKSNFISIVPLQDSTVTDFKTAYPILIECADSLTKLLTSRSTNFKTEKGLGIPDLSVIDQSHGFYAKVHYLDFPAMSGIFFITQYVQEETPITNEGLCCTFQGISKNHKYYIDAMFSTTNPLLKMCGDSVKAGIKEYNSESIKKLDESPDSMFNPSLTDIKKILTSLIFR